MAFSTFATALTGYNAQDSSGKMSEKLDDLEWHVESATAQGGGEYTGGAHIVYFLTWALERELLERGAVKEDLAGALRELEPGVFEELLDWFDGVLSTDALSVEGDAFASKCYESYLNEYTRLVGEAQYHEPNWSVYGRVREMLDELRQHGCA